MTNNNNNNNNNKLTYFNLKCKVIIKKDIYFRDAYSKIAYYII